MPSTGSKPGSMPRRTIQELETTISELQQSLAPAKREQIIGFLRLLVVTLRAENDDASMEERLSVYLIAVRDISLSAIRRTTEKIIQGRVPEVTKFLPTAPELANICRAEESIDRRRLERFKDELRIRKALPPPDLSPEEEARRAAKFAKAKASLDLPSAQPHEPKWFDKPMVVEQAAEMSPELKAVLKRKWHIMGGPMPKPEEDAAE